LLLRLLGQIRQNDRERIANLFSFKRFTDFQNRIKTLQTIAYALERLAPALANDGPNPEYPWPHAEPQIAPVNHKFSEWASLTTTGPGRDLLRIIKIAVNHFSDYADT